MFFIKKPRHSNATTSDSFDPLPDDIIISILCKLSSTARRPSDFINILLICKRLNRLALHPNVLHVAGPETLAVAAKNWCDAAHRFFKQCIIAGNVEAYYTLGMIRFYCLQNRRSGASLMAKAAIRSHAPSLYSLAVIHFNGSSGLENGKDLRAGVALCARAAYLGHIDAIRELGHCLQDGYGVRKSVTEGRRLLMQANARELACLLRDSKLLTWLPSNQSQRSTDHAQEHDPATFWSEFRSNIPVHPANRFLVEWYQLRSKLKNHELESGQYLRSCSNMSCGRPEIRRNEFRRCSGCGKVNYCSRGCQAHDWKMRHKVECAPMEQWMDQEVDDPTVVDHREYDPTVEIE